MTDKLIQEKKESFEKIKSNIKSLFKKNATVSFSEQFKTTGVKQLNNSKKYLVAFCKEEADSKNLKIIKQQEHFLDSLVGKNIYIIIQQDKESIHTQQQQINKIKNIKLKPSQDVNKSGFGKFISNLWKSNQKDSKIRDQYQKQQQQVSHIKSSISQFQSSDIQRQIYFAQWIKHKQQQFLGEEQKHYNYRLGFVYQRQQELDRHFWVYFYTKQEMKREQERLKFIILKNYHGFNAKLLEEEYEKRIVTEVSNLLIDTLLRKKQKQEQQRLQQQLKQRIYIDENIHQDYEKQHYIRYLKKLKDIAYESKRMSENVLFLQIHSIKIDKKAIKKDNQELYAELQIQTNKKSYVQTFVQKEEEQPTDYHAFVSNSRQVYKFLQAQFMKKTLNFKVTIRNRTKTFVEKIYQQQKNFEVQNLSIRSMVGSYYEMPLNPKTNEQFNLRVYQNYPFLLCFQSIAKKSAKLIMDDVNKYRKLKVVEYIGLIPSNHFKVFKFPYNPNNFQLIQSIITSDKNPLTKQSYQNVYWNLFHFFQKQEAESNNLEYYYQILRKTSEIKECQECFTSQQRFKYYMDILQRTGKKQFFQSKGIVNRTDLSNLEDDLENCKYSQKPLLKTILNMLLIKFQQVNSNQPSDFKYLPFLIPIAEKLLDMAFESNQYSANIRRLQDSRQYGKVVGLLYDFLEQMYPYFKFSNFQNQLYHLRALVQKYLPNLCMTLNRKGIGLQNYVASYLLELFTSLPNQIVYRIWDFIIVSRNKKKARIIVMYTILLYSQSNDFLPIFPINLFIKSVSQNYIKMNLEQNIVYHFQKHVDHYHKKFADRKQKVKELSKQKYLKRFILNKNTSDLIPKQNKGVPIDVNMSSSTHKKLLSLNELRYPIPQPNYTGHAVDKIDILINTLYILENINMSLCKYLLLVQYGQFQMCQQQITSKNSHMNWNFQFNYEPNVNLLKFQIVEQKNVKASVSRFNYKIRGSLDLQNYHKSTIYKINVLLTPQKQVLQNKGQTCLTISLCLRTVSQYRKQLLKPKNDTSYLDLCNVLLDYSWDHSSNDALKATEKLYKFVQKMKRPLDQFGKQEYFSLKISTLNYSVDEWLKNSSTTIQQFKAILNAVFTSQDQQNFRLKFSIYYKLYSDQILNQMSFGEMMLTLIMNSRLSIRKKLILIFCLGVHYQNCNSKAISVETLSSIVQNTYKQLGLLNAVPYLVGNTGQIDQACFYENDKKMRGSKRDITQIIQDWVYICHIKFGYKGILLGSSEDLSVLRSLLTLPTLRKIAENPLCRFQIIYTLDGRKHIWSATVNTSDFSIVHRGVKFLDNYPEYHQINYLDSTAEILLTCQNCIPLTVNRNISYDDLRNFIKQKYNYIFAYGLCQGSEQQVNKNKEIIVDEPKIITTQQIPQMSEYTDKAIYRYQNCIQQWKSCKIDEEQQHTSKVRFQHMPNKIYIIPQYQVFNMSENFINQQFSSKMI